MARQDIASSTVVHITGAETGFHHGLL